MTDTAPARIPLGGFRELGPLNWLIARLGARKIRAPRFSLFHVLGQHRLLFLAWLPYSALLLYRGKLSRQDAELIILRVGHLRGCEYELQQHRRLARSRGLDAELQAAIFAGPDAEGLSERQRVLLRAVDEFVLDRQISPAAFAALRARYSRAQLIEFCMLAGQYDSLAATINTLRVPLDFPD
ncbi:carboxymuconolactone decarboxylase family protein [uncultured Mycolicibacterium sp.]|uniref:carboxymuconolactone decarboxylase family protein n=1 Tax=uncultured Mycolicibacterium sp. TaxID=2320817 RepID=UPI002637B274|nr:carboxymuconolactone decarboxylase family protein [uncultured Mycolicibacterium sp.]